MCSEASSSPWPIVGQGAAALAASMGIGRFVYTPILPLMQAQTSLSPQWGSALATANYVGYLAGASAGILVPALVRSAVALRTSLIVLVATLALMPVTQNDAVWAVLRLTAGASSALVFVIAVSAVHRHLRDHGSHLTGWAFGGIGTGIALSGILVLLLRSVATWRAAWWASAALALVLAAGAWALQPEPEPEGAAGVRRAGPGTDTWFWALFAGYTLEGVGYIIAGTFLVAAIDQNASGSTGSGAWVLVGLAALPSCALLARLGKRWPASALLPVALVIQALGIALPAVSGGIGPAVVSALLFGATFVGVTSMALGIGAHLRFPRAVALLTTGYGAGQIAGPLVVTPLLSHGYQQPLLVGAAAVLAAALASAALRFRFPRRPDRVAEISR
ncbi:YbfB/YjiJ family MFS transporter [Pseudonocardia xinjiangensis]|uniref:YbfB/YjiJ family MFS transporter n=1 Tax=Pseudonocardia xinjiangensis TaxID=75289 RepID=UPI003D89B5DC